MINDLIILTIGLIVCWAGRKVWVSMKNGGCPGCSGACGCGCGGSYCSGSSSSHNGVKDNSRKSIKR